MSLANFIHTVLAADTLGLPSAGSSIMRSAPTDVPNKEQFVILRWGTESPGPGRDSRVQVYDLSIWAYDRQPTYARLTTALNRAKNVLLALEAVQHTVSPAGWITSISWQGRSPDLDDDVYKAAVRSDTYRIVAS